MTIPLFSDPRLQFPELSHHLCPQGHGCGSTSSRKPLPGTAQLPLPGSGWRKQPPGSLLLKLVWSGSPLPALASPCGPVMGQPARKYYLQTFRRAKLKVFLSQQCLPARERILSTPCPVMGRGVRQTGGHPESELAPCLCPFLLQSLRPISLPSGSAEGKVGTGSLKVNCLPPSSFLLLPPSFLLPP